MVIKSLISNCILNIIKILYKIQTGLEGSNYNVDQQQGLKPETVQQFHLFQANQSLVIDQCSICMEDIELGRKMIRLDCKHVFCQVCIK